MSKIKLNSIATNGVSEAEKVERKPINKETSEKFRERVREIRRNEALTYYYAQYYIAR